MTDISVFKKMLDQRPYSTARGYVYLAGSGLLTCHNWHPGIYVG
jgi:hypothetical protein